MAFAAAQLDALADLARWCFVHGLSFIQRQLHVTPGSAFVGSKMADLPTGTCVDI